LIITTLDELSEILKIKKNRPRLAFFEFQQPQQWMITLGSEKGLKLNIDQALEALETYTDAPFRTLHFYGDFNWQLHPATLKRLKNIIITSKKIEKIWFDTPITAMKTIRKALEKNTSVNSLTFSFPFPTIEPLNFTESVTKLLQSNRRIQKLSIAYEESCAKFIKEIFTAASSNPSIYNINISEKTSGYEGNYLGNRVDLIRDLVANNSNITDLRIGKCYIKMETLLGKIVDIIQQNKLKTFAFGSSLRGCDPLKTDLTKFFDAIRLNTSLTTLNLSCDYFSIQDIATIMENTNIKVLHVNCRGYCENIRSALMKNTTLESFTMVHRNDYWSEDTTNKFFDSLRLSPALKSISFFGIYSSVGQKTLWNFLENNPQLISVELGGIIFVLPVEDNPKLSPHLSLKKLQISLEWNSEGISPVLAALPSLTSINIGRKFSLTVQKNVIESDPKNWLCLQHNEMGEVMAILQRNRERVAAERYSIFYATKAIRKFLWDQLPTEIWFKIFAELTRGTSIDVVNIINND
jgi:hypothetical protein